jgi:hypothetical protein
MKNVKIFSANGGQFLITDKKLIQIFYNNGYYGGTVSNKPIQFRWVYLEDLRRASRARKNKFVVIRYSRRFASGNLDVEFKKHKNRTAVGCQVFRGENKKLLDRQIGKR